MPDPKQMSFMWDKRYGTEDYAYGKEANAFFSTQLDGTGPGLMLLPGEGEGRNAVYASRKGWVVDAFDQSSVGQAKALALVLVLFSTAWAVTWVLTLLMQPLRRSR